VITKSSRTQMCAILICQEKSRNGTIRDFNEYYDSTTLRQPAARKFDEKESNRRIYGWQR